MLQTQVHNAQNLIGDSSAGGKGLRPVASPLEKEVSCPAARSLFSGPFDGWIAWLTMFLSC